MNITLLERFLRHVNKTPGCWIWTGCGNDRAHFQIGSKRISQANRISWIIFKGPIPKGKCVLHRCDNGRCVNPEHLFIGTFADNSFDMLNKKRGNYYGRPQRLTPKDVLRIRAIYIPHKYTCKMIAKEYGCHYGTIYAALTRTWKTV